MYTLADEKAQFSITKELVRARKKVNGQVNLDALYNVTKSQTLKLISEKVIYF